MAFDYRKLIKNSKGFTDNLNRKDMDKLLDSLDLAYHVDMAPVVPDKTYDTLLDIYFKKYPKSKRKAKVGHSLGNKKEEVTLSTPMPSLNKVKPGDKKLTTFIQNSEVVLSDKLDGISLKADYVKGVLKSVFTRGNGTKGKDVSYIIKYSKLPKKLSKRVTLSIRLEAIIATKTFDKKFSKGSGGEFTAARNFVGGQINSPTKALKSVDMVAFEILEGKGSEKPLSKQLTTLMNLGITTVFHAKAVVTEDVLSSLYDARIKASPYEIDGIVVTKDVSYTRSARDPKHAVAYKENSEADMKVVKVIDVVWEISRTGKIVPRVFYKETQLGGVNNTKATGHNALFILNGYSKRQELAAKKLGLTLKKKPIGPGAKIKIVRSGKVIPYIVSVVSKSKTGKAKMPDVDYVIKGVEAYYSGKGNKDADLKQIAHFFTTIGIDGMKLTTIKHLASNGLDSITKIMNAEPEDFLSIDRIGEKKAYAWHSQIAEKLKVLDWPTAAYASSVFPNFGKSRFETIFENYPRIYRNFKDVPDVERKVLELEGFSELAGTFAKNLKKLVRFLRKHDIKPKRAKKVAAVGSAMSGVRVTMTGVRDNEITSFVTQQGGVVQNMKADTNLLVIKDSSYTSAKVEKAIDKGTPVLTVSEFKAKYF